MHDSVLTRACTSSMYSFAVKGQRLPVREHSFLTNHRTADAIKGTPLLLLPYTSPSWADGGSKKSLILPKTLQNYSALLTALRQEVNSTALSLLQQQTFFSSST